MGEKKIGRPASDENFVKKQISFPEKMLEDLNEISDKSGIKNLNAIVRKACAELIEKEKK